MSDKPYAIVKPGDIRRRMVKREGEVEATDGSRIVFARPVRVEITEEFKKSSEYSSFQWHETSIHLDTATPIPSLWQRIKDWFVKERVQLPKAKVIK